MDEAAPLFFFLTTAMNISILVISKIIKCFGKGRKTMEENAKQIAELLKMLANENRLMIFCCLLERPKTVGEIKKHLPGITQSALSQHLALLKAHGALDFKKSGQNVTYSISDYRVKEIIDVLKKYYCESEEALK